MIEQKNEWLVVVWNDGISQFFIERLTATEEEIKRYLLSLIEDDKKLSQETCNDCTDSIDGIGTMKNPLQKVLWRFMRMLLLIHIISSMKHAH